MALCPTTQVQATRTALVNGRSGTHRSFATQAEHAPLPPTLNPTMCTQDGLRRPSISIVMTRFNMLRALRAAATLRLGCRMKDSPIASMQNPNVFRDSTLEDRSG
jgi:hypothetical protein